MSRQEAERHFGVLALQVMGAHGPHEKPDRAGYDAVFFARGDVIDPIGANDPAANVNGDWQSFSSFLARR